MVMSHSYHQMPMRHLGLYLTSLIPAAMLLVAPSGHRRYGYFGLLRLVVNVGAAFLALTAHKLNAAGWMWAMIGILVLFNPLVPIQYGGMWGQVKYDAEAIYESEEAL